MTMQHFFRALGSYLISLRASALLGRGYKLQRAGKLEEALSVARQGLRVLGKPGVVRHHPAEGAVLSSLTILVEDISGSTQGAGASETDIRDTLDYLKQLPPGSVDEVQSWIPYLESRINGSNAA
jgi:hypothetical protein